MNAGAHQYEDKLLDYAYGELPAHEASAVDAHVRTCAKCSQALGQIRGVRTVFASLPTLEAPAAGLDSLIAYAEHHARRSKEMKQAPWRKWVFAVASGAALVFVGVVALRASDRSPQHASDVLIAAAVETERTDEPRDEPTAEPQTLRNSENEGTARPSDERLSKRGAPPPPAEAKALVQDDKDSNFANSMGGMGSRSAPGKEAMKNLGSQETLASDSLSTGRASAAKREKAVVAQVEKQPPPRDPPSGRGVGAESPKAGEKRAVDNIDDTLNDGTSVKQSMFGGNASRRDFGVASDSSESPAAAFRDTKDKARPEATTQPLPAPEIDDSPRPSLPPPPRKSGYGLPQVAPTQASAPSSRMAESVAPPEGVEARSVRGQQVKVDAQLAQSRTAGTSGDRRGEVMAAVAALNAGAIGYSRLEALKRACDGFEAMGESDRARPYCERVVAEFAGSAAARQVAERQKARMKSPASAPPASKADSEKQQAKPAEALH
jgi:hypothetical protein